jgi:hypothetical protein
MTTYLASLAVEETADAMESPAQPVDDLGVTRLADTCGHVFCRKELSACSSCRTLGFGQIAHFRHLVF